MNFYDEKGRVCQNIEYVEQALAEEFVQPDDVVLELGARYGSVTVAISRKLRDSSNCVSVEPDERVWAVLDRNLATFGSKAQIVKGFVSKSRMTLTNLSSHDGYGTTCVPDKESAIPTYTVNDLETKYNLKFTVLIADCEGFLGTFIDENMELLSQLRLIIFEADYPDKCDYNRLRDIFRSANFHEVKNVQNGFHNVWLKSV
jgi:FkbM family methyltransferase